MDPALAPLLVVAFVVATGGWVLIDAQRQAESGHPVTTRIGPVLIDRPTTWSVGTIALWIFVFPLYLATRRNPR